MKNTTGDYNLYVLPHDYNIRFSFLNLFIGSSAALRFLRHKLCIRSDSMLLLPTLDFWRGEKAAFTEQNCLLGIANDSPEPYSNLTFTTFGTRFGPCELHRHAKGMQSTQQES